MGKTINILDFNTTENISLRRMISIVIRLSIPAVMAQLTSVMMQYIDAAMVGTLGANASASIGLVSSTTWLLNGLCISVSTGFSVQIAQLVGAGRADSARNVFRQALVITTIFGLLIASVALAISPVLPVWLGGNRSVCPDSSRYFMIYALALPATQLRQIAGASLQCSGDMKTPSMLNILMCFLDVVFNYFLIYPSRAVTFLGFEFNVFGVGMGVSGAALGTALADYVVAFSMLYVAAVKSDVLAFRHGGSWKLQKRCFRTAFKISLPAAFEHAIMCTAYICATMIVAPLGTVAVAANSLAVTAESFCYMPGYGISSASTTLVGQSIGAGRRDIAKRFASTAVLLGISIMSLTAILMYVAAPWMFNMLTSSAEVRQLGTDVLRIEAFAEPLYAASIVCTGVLRGAGDTLIPGILNLVSMWGVRITLSFILVPYFGLYGVWIAMAVELCVRGILYLVRVYRGKWVERKIDV